jgi:RNA polymerase sigma factor (sigma-70 family)
MLEKSCDPSKVECREFNLSVAAARSVAVQLMARASEAQQLGKPDGEQEAHLCALVACMARRGPDAEQALSSLYDLTVRRVAAIIGRFLPDRELVAEVTQDTFFQAWNQADSFDAGRGCVLAWLLVIARSRALDARRRKQAQPVLFDSDIADAMLEVTATHQPSALEVVNASQLQRLVQEAILKLNPKTRHLLALAFFSDLSHSEISACMHMPLGTIKSTLRRGLDSMESELERIAPGTGRYFGLALTDDPQAPVRRAADSEEI